MPSGITTFPEGFLYHIEGRNTNDTWYAWEQETGRIVDGATATVACGWWSFT